MLNSMNMLRNANNVAQGGLDSVILVKITV